MSEPDLADDPLATDAGWGRWIWAFRLLIAGAIVAGVIARFATNSPLWLDETLSVNIARLPIGQIPEALRHDGHPPLFYVLLHGWMDVFGEGDHAVRAFSGVWSLALFPLVWFAGRRFANVRVAWFAVALLALSPYGIRYGAETRMYAMVSVIVLVGWFVLDDALRTPAAWRLAVIALLTGTLLWTHYWAMWLLGTVGVMLLVRAWHARRDERADDLRATLLVVGAVIAGGLLFLPWVPSLLYQGTHTGTPWARPVRPTEMMTFTIADLGGGADSEAVLVGWFVAILIMIGILGKAVTRFRVELDVRTRPQGRQFAIVILGTMGLACAVGYLTGATYASRYAAVFYPFLILLAALGLDQVRSRPFVLGILSVVLVLGAIGGVRSVTRDRSDSRRSAAAIEAYGRPGDLIIYCPDQLGPSTSRVLGRGFDQVTYPEFGKPARVDWVDYTARLKRTNTREFAKEALERAGRRNVFLVYSVTYQTHNKICPRLFNALGRVRPPKVLTDPTMAYEPSSVVLFPAPKD